MLALALAAAPSAHAGLLGSSSTSCTSLGTTSKPFARWLDYFNYQLFPGGSFEATKHGWTLSKAAVVTGNEAFYVRQGTDMRALEINAGGSARSASFCVGIEHPTIRLFARNTGSALGRLDIAVTFKTPLGLTVTQPVGSVLGAAHASWAPTLPQLVPVTIPLIAGGTPITFRFTASGSTWRIDDVYVDPYRRG